MEEGSECWSLIAVISGLLWMLLVIDRSDKRACVTSHESVAILALVIAAQVLPSSPFIAAMVPWVKKAKETTTAMKAMKAQNAMKAKKTTKKTKKAMKAKKAMKKPWNHTRQLEGFDNLLDEDEDEDERADAEAWAKAVANDPSEDLSPDDGT